MAIDDLRQNDMMAHLLDALEASTDIGRYGRLTFAMVARHFMSDDELVAWLTKDPTVE
jgi:transposase